MYIVNMLIKFEPRDAQFYFATIVMIFETTGKFIMDVLRRALSV